MIKAYVWMSISKKYSIVLKSKVNTETWKNQHARE